MKLRGSITIFLSLTIMIVIAVICTVIESARVSVAQTEGKAFAYMAVDSVFAGYGRQVYEDYGILLAWEQEPLEEQVKRYMQANINKADLEGNKYDFMKMNVSNVEVVRQKYMTDEEGELFAKQVVRYTKYLATQDAINSLISKFNKNESNNETNSNEKESNVTNIANEVSKEISEIVEKINQELNILKDTSKLKKKMAGTNDKYSELKEDISNGSQNSDSHDKKVRKFQAKYKKLMAVLKTAQEDINETLELVNKYLNKKQEVEKKYGKSLEGYEDYIAENKSSLEQVNNNITWILSLDIEKLEDINTNNIDAVNQAIDKIQSVEKQLWELKISEKPQDTSEEESLYESAKSLVTTGVLGLVLDDVTSVSKESISNLNLPSNLEKTNTQKSALSDVEKRAAFVKYIECYFSNYVQDTKYGKNDTALKYEMEYILCGKVSDKENLTGVIEQLVVIRNISNMAYLVTDAEKMEEITSLSETVALAVGVPFLTPVIQAILLEAWSLTEAVIDVRALVNNKKIPIVKTKDNWQSQLKNIGKTESNKENTKGLDYTEYLEILLLAQNPHDTVFRTMDLIQVNIQKRYNPAFLMTECFGQCEIMTMLSIEPVFSAIPVMKFLINKEDKAYEFQINEEYRY